MKITKLNVLWSWAQILTDAWVPFKCDLFEGWRDHDAARRGQLSPASAHCPRRYVHWPSEWQSPPGQLSPDLVRTRPGKREEGYAVRRGVPGLLGRRCPGLWGPCVGRIARTLRCCVWWVALILFSYNYFFVFCEHCLICYCYHCRVSCFKSFDSCKLFFAAITGNE